MAADIYNSPKQIEIKTKSTGASGDVNPAYKVQRRKFMSIKNIARANKNAKMNEQLRRSNKIKTGLAATGATTTAAGAFAAWFFTRREAKKNKNQSAKIDEQQKQINEQQKQINELQEQLNELKGVKPAAPGTSAEKVDQAANNADAVKNPTPQADPNANANAANPNPAPAAPAVTAASGTPQVDPSATNANPAAPAVTGTPAAPAVTAASGTPVVQADQG